MPNFFSALIGSRSNTPNESIQQSNSNTVKGYSGEGRATGNIDSEIVAEISKLLKAGASVKIRHKYRHFTARPGLTDVHHSQIFVENTGGDVLFNFGLWTDDTSKIMFEQDIQVKYYKDSTTYAPNPVTVTPQKFLEAFLATRRKCGPDYKLLHNNCQKFARLFMEELGAKHTRRKFFL
ncbi:hypothetical protein VVD49_13950 [Uliginosibacterium sp. H3]|uniref:Lecithin retinol acyltransferase n=1 Tax=Uliginosibacterium silvisoli TaxID=3114758 RepID=A0ABU6K5G3_9RHOO|nr:hypothetical protein [Uliginosibacterium sp. H3]